jgi:hypothetical protein
MKFRIRNSLENDTHKVSNSKLRYHINNDTPFNIFTSQLKMSCSVTVWGHDDDQGPGEGVTRVTKSWGLGPRQALGGPGKIKL